MTDTPQATPSDAVPDPVVAPAGTPAPAAKKPKKEEDWKDTLSFIVKLVIVVAVCRSFLFSPFSESLFLACSVGAVYAARHRHWVLAGGLGAAAALTRSIGIILCAGKKRETVEYLDLDARGIHVAEYLTELPPRKVLEERLHRAIEVARNRLVLEAGVDTAIDVAHTRSTKPKRKGRKK